MKPSKQFLQARLRSIKAEKALLELQLKEIEEVETPKDIDFGAIFGVSFREVFANSIKEFNETRSDDQIKAKIPSEGIFKEMEEEEGRIEQLLKDSKELREIGSFKKLTIDGESFYSEEAVRETLYKIIEVFHDTRESAIKRADEIIKNI